MKIFQNEIRETSRNPSVFYHRVREISKYLDWGEKLARN